MTRWQPESNRRSLCREQWSFAVAAVLMLASTARANPQSQPDDFIPGKTVKVTCHSDSDYHYTLYLPSDYTKDKKWPILYTHGPGGGGYVDNLRTVCEEMGFICVGLTESRNGPWDNILKNQAAVWKDRRLLSIDPRRSYAFGFSGGARASWAFAFQHPRDFAGVIGAGGDYGGLPPGLPPKAEYARQVAGYFLTGDSDDNRKFIETCASNWKRWGGQTVLDVRPGQGHSGFVPEGAAMGLRWMEMLWWKTGNAGHERIARVFAGWSKGIDGRSAKAADWELFCELEQFVPMFSKAALKDEQKAKYLEISKRFDELKADEKIKSQVAAKQRFTKACAAAIDARGRGGSGLAPVAKEFNSISSQYPDTEYGQRAAKRFEELKKELGK